MKEVICPACGALIEAEQLETLVELAKEHTLATHQYLIPEEHVIQAATEATG